MARDAWVWRGDEAGGEGQRDERQGQEVQPPGDGEAVGSRGRWPGPGRSRPARRDAVGRQEDDGHQRARAGAARPRRARRTSTTVTARMRSTARTSRTGRTKPSTTAGCEEVTWRALAGQSASQRRRPGGQHRVGVDHQRGGDEEDEDQQRGGRRRGAVPPACPGARTGTRAGGRRCSARRARPPRARRCRPSGPTPRPAPSPATARRSRAAPARSGRRRSGTGP